jgi:hypothetical protein
MRWLTWPGGCKVPSTAALHAMFANLGTQVECICRQRVVRLVAVVCVVIKCGGELWRATLCFMKDCGEEHIDHLRGSLHADTPLQFAVGDDKLLWRGVYHQNHCCVIWANVWACHNCACCALGIRSSCRVQPSYLACHVRQRTPCMGQF